MEFFKKKTPSTSQATTSFSQKMRDFVTPKKVVKTTAPAPEAPKPESKRKKATTSGWDIFTTRFSIKDQVLFAKRLSFLVNAGVPILESLYILQEQTKGKGHKRVLERIIRDVANGSTLSTSLARHKYIFGDFAVNLIRVGESSGILGKNLNYLADELKKKSDLRRKAIGSLIYPIFITIATLLLTALLTVFIFPKILPIFSSMNVTLPLSTKILIFISKFLQDHGLALAGVIVVLAIVYATLHRKVAPFRFFMDRVMLRMPIMGNMMQQYNMANFSRTLGLLLKSGVPVMQSVAVVGDATRNMVYRRECYALAKRIEQGEQLSKYLKERGSKFPSILAHMVAVGEKTGKLSDTLLYLSEYYETEVDERTKNLSHTIEPVLMIFLGVMVGFVAVSVISPIYQITQSLGR